MAITTVSPEEVCEFCGRLLAEAGSHIMTVDEQGEEETYCVGPPTATQYNRLTDMLHAHLSDIARYFNRMD